MASSTVMAATSPSNADLPRDSFTQVFSVSELQTDQSNNFASMNMDELLDNIYGDTEAFLTAAVNRGSGGGCVEGVSLSNHEREMTLEDYLTKAGAVREEDVRMPETAPPPLGFGVDSIMNAARFQATPRMQSSQNRLGRGKRKVVEAPPVAKATLEKQRRMIKNRESAARSRERKQAYTDELESLVKQLEEENARLLKREAEHTKERFKQLTENLIPFGEKRRPPRIHRRVHSM